MLICVSQCWWMLINDDKMKKYDHDFAKLKSKLYKPPIAPSSN